MPAKSDQKTTTLLVKNMVCARCVRVVREELQKLGIDVRGVILGEVVVSGSPSKIRVDKVRNVLAENGFELIEDRKAKIIEQVKHAILKLVHHGEEAPTKLKHSKYLEQEVGMDYHYLSTLFSSVENITIEQYIILQRIEHVKELLKYGELTLSEISYKLGYSSVQHLSNQFKSVTGMTPSRFKRLTGIVRKPVDRITA